MKQSSAAESPLELTFKTWAKPGPKRRAQSAGLALQREDGYLKQLLGALKPGARPPVFTCPKAE